MNAKELTADELIQWSQADVFVWATCVNNAAQPKDRSTVFPAAGTQWKLVRSTAVSPKPSVVVTLQGVGGGPRQGDGGYNAMQLRILLVHAADPAKSLMKEKVFFLDPPKDVTLSCQMPLDEMDPGWLDEGRLQVRAAVRPIQTGPQIASRTSDPQLQLQQQPYKENDAPLPGDMQAMAAQQQQMQQAQGGLYPQGSQVLMADPANDALRLRKRSRDNYESSGAALEPNGLHPPQSAAAGGALQGRAAQPPCLVGTSGASLEEETAVRLAAINALYPLVKRLKGDGAPSRAVLWQALGQRVSAVEAKLICDLGVQMLNEELEEPPTQTAPARCVALMETMLRLAK